MNHWGLYTMPFPILLRFVLFITYSIIASADNKETEAAILSTFINSAPVYTCLRKYLITNIHEDASKTDIRKVYAIKKGKDTFLLATGETVRDLSRFC
ncbi:hypothetical protein V4B17_00740 [Bartonella sp. B23]